jgi:heme a synthase
MNEARTIAPGEALPPGAMSSPVPSAARRRYTALVAGFALLVIFAGAQVKSHQAGLAVPDWPLSYGQWMPPMVGNIFHEHGHRIVAATVGLLTVLLAGWTAAAEARRGVRVLAWWAVAVVVAQGVLGGLTVRHLLPPQLSITHAVLAQTFFVLVATLAFACSREGARAPAERATPALAAAARSAGWAAGALWVQLVLGAIMRHNEAGLAVPFFPVDDAGRLLPERVDGRAVLHLLHRGFAFVVLPLVLLAAWRAARALPRLAGHAALAAAGVLGQVLLGAAVIWTARVAEVDARTPVVTPAWASAHVAGGAALLALTWLLFLRARHVVRPVRGAAGPRAERLAVAAALVLLATMVVLMASGPGDSA